MQAKRRPIRKVDQYLYCSLKEGNDADRFSLGLLMMSVCLQSTWDISLISVKLKFY